jgi:glycosyltransferase involved in cell wall biosynthesis
MDSTGHHRPLRVVHVIGGLELGGAETLLYRLATHDIAGVEQEVICLGNPDWYSTRLQDSGVRVHHLGMSSPARAVERLGDLRRLLRSRRPDVIQSWMYFANMLSSLLARRTRTPVVWGIHNSSFERVGLASRLCAYAGGFGARGLAKFVINCSQRSSEIHRGLGYSAVSNGVIPNGYDADTFCPDPDARASIRRSLGLDDQTFVIGSIARWHPHKDVPNLLRAVRLAADQGVPLRCLLIGGGLDADNRALADAIRRAGCEEFVMPLGTRGDVPDLARALDLHVSSSRSEAFPNVVAETMLSATPNVVTDVGDSALIVGDTGWVMPPCDPHAMAEAIAEAWRERTSDESQWEQRRIEARMRIAERFTFERMAEAYHDVWRRVAGRG